MSGVAFATVGYFGIFGAGAVCDTLGVLYVAFVLKAWLPDGRVCMVRLTGQGAAKPVR